MKCGQFVAFSCIFAGLIVGNSSFAAPQYRSCREHAVIEGPVFEKPAMEEWTLRAPIMEKPQVEKPKMDRAAFDRAAFDRAKFEKSAIEKPLFDDCRNVKAQAAQNVRLTIPRDNLARAKGLNASALVRNSKLKPSTVSSSYAGVREVARPSDCGCDQSTSRVATAPKVVSR